MIGYWHHPVVSQSVCLSVCGSQGWCTRLKLAPSIHFPICPFWHFCCRMYRLATKCITKKRTVRATNLSPNTRLSRSSAASRLVNNDTVPFGATAEACAECRLHVQRGARTANLRTQIRSNCQLDSRTDSKRIFYSEVEMLCSQWIALKYCMQCDRLSQQ